MPREESERKSPTTKPERVHVWETEPTHESKLNPRIDFKRDGSGNPTQIDVLTNSETYRIELTWVNNELTHISSFRTV